jgi:hypothetical protein
MIEVSVQPSRLVAGRRTTLIIRFANTGQGACTSIVFRLGLPPGIVLMSGRGKVEIQSIPPGGVHTHEVAVQPTKPGNFELDSGNFSWRDEFGVSRQVTDFGWELSVQDAPFVPSAPAREMVPQPKVELEHANGALALGRWDELNILLRNDTGVPLSDVTMAVSGAIRTNGGRARVRELPSGKAAKAPFNVIADEAGRVRVTVHTTFSYPDGLGSVRPAAQDDSIYILVTKPPEPATGTPAGASRVQTVLFLAASPRDLEPLRPDQELRLIEQQMQLDPNRGDFRLEPRVAAQLTDISRALVRYKPQVVHFSGHGDAGGRVYVEDENGLSKPVNPDGLARMFGKYKATIQCVVVNACHSMRLAEAMSQHIRYVVGMRSGVGDNAAILFSVGFYQALFGGEEVPDAFELACSLLQSDEATNPEYLTPVLYPPGPK